ncbi:MAG: hypothetical protein DI616_09515 [Paracoccus denitrificans]|uniref:Sulfotransferase family protein n=1 Tax=Paracoccus denitrificans TaxID=266 RepID=A0A533IAR3_PARDE|nr:MAG: hypothetical protein DI616_09515 [Paracoccus denitrificans]
MKRGGAKGGNCSLILHVGLPKAGSSALQTALGQSPDLVTASGQRLRYTVLRQSGGRLGIIDGRDLTLATRRSAFGYATSPNTLPAEIDSPVFDKLRKVMHQGERDGVVPILSSEGWVRRPDLFATHLARWGNPNVEVVAFLRPPVEWFNASFWQWGIWNEPDIDRWLQRTNQPYDFGLHLQKWAEIPNLRLRLASARPNVVQKFADLFALNLPGASSSNRYSPPALLGFLLRNRQFRPSAHDAEAEFIFQRWCPPMKTRRPWALQRRHVEQLLPTVTANRAALQRIATEAEQADIFADAGWDVATGCQQETDQGLSPLDDRAELAMLFASLVEGVSRASRAAGITPPQPPRRPSEDSEIARWDDALRPLMHALLRADAGVRAALWPRARLHLGMRLRQIRRRD